MEYSNLRKNAIRYYNKFYILIVILGFVAAFMMKGFYFNITSTITNIRYLGEGNNAVFLFGIAGYALCVSAIATLISYKHSDKILVAVNLLFSVIVFADAVYSRYYYMPLTTATLYQASLLGPITGSIVSLLKIKDIVFFIDFPVFIVLATLRSKISSNQAESDQADKTESNQAESIRTGSEHTESNQAESDQADKTESNQAESIRTGSEHTESNQAESDQADKTESNQAESIRTGSEHIESNQAESDQADNIESNDLKRFPKQQRRQGRLLRMVFSTSILVAGAVCFLIVWPFYNFQNYNYNSITKVMGIYYYHTYDVINFVKDNIFRSTSITDDELKTFGEFYERRNEEREGLINPYYCVGQGNNLLVLLVESMQQFVVGLEINGVEVTPNLNRFIRENIYFSQCYEQVFYGNTSDAEFILATSVYPAREGSAFMRYSSNTYESLPSIMNDEGYTTFTAHANTSAFWNRAAMYSSLGYGRVIDYNSYIIDEYKGWGGYALSDSSFFRQTIDAIYKEQPFYGLLITLSSHHPYSFFADSDEFDAGEYSGTLVGNYLKAINYTDACLGELFEDLKQKGVYDNTTIVLLGDHYAIQRQDAPDLQRLIRNETGRDVDFSNEASWICEQTVPLVFHVPQISEPMQYNFVCGEIDIAPTIAGIMGVKTEYSLGGDLFLREEVANENLQENNQGESRRDRPDDGREDGLEYNRNYRRNGYMLTRRGVIVTDDYVYTGAGGLFYRRNRDDGDSGGIGGSNTTLPILAPDGPSESEEDRIREIMYDLKITDMIIEKNILKTVYETHD